MESESAIRQAAVFLLDSAIRIAPRETRDWGQAMRVELQYVEGSFASLMWSLGAAAVLVKQALVDFFMPGPKQVPPGRGLFERSISLRRVALAVLGTFLLATLIFFAAPPFRQGLRVSLTAWSALLHATDANQQPELRALARRAEGRQDPEGMVFVAARLEDPNESARLATEAVRLDPSLIWAYAVVAARHPDLAEAREWIPALERWDSRNALFYLLTAEFIDRDDGVAPSPAEPAKTGTLSRSPAWQGAMSAAFASPEFDDYSDRLKELDRNVVRRYRFNDPFTIVWGEEQGTAWPAGDSQQFARSLLQSGEALEAAGDDKGAGQKYWTVAGFGQVVDFQGHTAFDHWAGTILQSMAYRRLRGLTARQGNASEATLFGYLAATFDPVKGVHARAGDERVFGVETCGRNAAVLQIASLLMLVFFAIMVTTGAILIAAGRRGGMAPGGGEGTLGGGDTAATARVGGEDTAATVGAEPVKPAATVLAMASAVGFLISNAAIYLTYRPYWYIFQRTILKGDRSQARDLLDFLLSTRVLPGLTLFNNIYLPSYFWTGIVLLGIFGLILILLRHLRSRARIDAPRHSAHVP